VSALNKTGVPKIKEGSQDMAEGERKPVGPLESVADELGVAEVVRFYSEVGRDVVALGRMLGAATETRPFVYELRVDLWPASNTGGLTVAKGFGAEGSLIAFQEGSGLVGQLRGLYGRMRAGKLRFSEDKFPPGNYEKRCKAWLAEQEYLAAKLQSR